MTVEISNHLVGFHHQKGLGVEHVAQEPVINTLRAIGKRRMAGQRKNDVGKISRVVMEFDEYLIQKKIDARQFQRLEPERYAEWEREFRQMSPASFTVQKKFLLNDTRRKYIVR